MKSDIHFKGVWIGVALASYIIFSNINLSFTSLYIIPLTYLVFALSYSRTIRFYKFGSKYDISYGAYIYAFVIQQTIYHVTGGSLPFAINIILSVLITLPFAFLSYVLVEKPALRLK